MLKKRLCSLFLALSVGAGLIPMSLAAEEQVVIMAEDAVTEDIIVGQQETAGENELPVSFETNEISGEEPSDGVISVEMDEADPMSAEEAEFQDPERFKNDRPHTTQYIPMDEQPIADVMMMGSRSVYSPFTDRNYTVTKNQVSHIIDVSKWDGAIDWNKVKNAGFCAAIVRAGYRGYENGVIYDDPYYETYMKNAKKAGVKLGVYIFSQAITKKEAREEAKYCIKKAKGYNLTLPIVMDVEYADNDGRLYQAKLSRSELTDVCLAFIDECRDAGYKPMIYANKKMLEDKMDAAKLAKKASIWLAQYNTAPSYEGSYKIWQYSEDGRVPGINTYIDCNFGFGMNLAPATKVTLKETQGLVYKNSVTLKATTVPKYSTDDVKWSSSNTSVATVSSNGKVTAKKPGNATIKAAAGSHSDTCRVTVRPRKTTITSIATPSARSIRIRWTKRAEATSYNIYRAESKDGAFKKIASTTSTTYKSTNLKKKKMYYYRVRAVAAGIRSDASATKYIRTK